MDDQKKLILWAANLPNEFRTEITNFDWPQRFKLNSYDYHFKFFFENNYYEGRGFSSSSEIALVKSISEAIERTVLVSNKINNSNGIAAHFQTEIAIENAICELVERDLFLCNFICPTAGVQEIKIEDTSEFCVETLKIFKNNNVKSKLYNLGYSAGKHVTLAISNGSLHKNPFGCIVGLGASESKLSSISSAFIEMSRSTITYLDSEICKDWLLAEEEIFQKEKSFNILSHAHLALTKKYSALLWDYYLSKEKYDVIESDLHLSEINTSLLKLNSFFCTTGLKVAQAKSDSVQNLFFQKTDLNKINLKRLERYLSQTINIDSLNLNTHPLA